MNQEPPILQPIDDKEFYTSIENQSPSINGTIENQLNGYLNNENGTSSPTMPVLYQADKEPPNILNINELFSSLANDEYETTTSEYPKLSRKESDSFFEKMYKDYSTTLVNSNMVDSTKDSTTSPQETTESEFNYNKPDNDADKTVNNILKSTPKKSHSENNLTKSQTKPEIPKKTKKRKLKKVSEPVIEEEDFRKYGIKSISKKDVCTKPNNNNTKITPAKDISTNKYLKSPFITLRKSSPKKQCQTVNVISTEYEIINPALKGTTDYQVSVYRPNLKLLGSNLALSPHQCICAFCGKTSEFLELGSLYGPYFIDSESIHGLPLTCLFPYDNQQNSAVGVSGKSAIKPDKNGGLKMVIQSTRSGRNSNAKKTVSEDYRVTWDGEVWFHRECILWAPCTYLRGDGKIGGLEEALKMALNAECCVCRKIGAILNCTAKNCEKNFHFYCALTLGSKLNHEQFSMLCNKHKDKC